MQGGVCALQLQAIQAAIEQAAARVNTNTSGSPIDRGMGIALPSGMGPIQRVAQKDFTNAFAKLQNFRFEKESDAVTFWTETVYQHCENSEVYYCYLSLNKMAMNNSDLENMLKYLVDDEKISKADCEAFVTGVNASFPKSDVAAKPVFMNMFEASEINEEANPEVLTGFVKEFLGPLQEVVAMKPTPDAALAGAQLLIEICERLGPIAHLANAEDPGSAAIISALNRGRFIERLVNILALQDDASRVLCHETEIARPLINALVNAKAPGVKLSTGTEIPVEDNLQQRAFSLYKKMAKEYKAKK